MQIFFFRVMLSSAVTGSKESASCSQKREMKTISHCTKGFKKVKNEGLNCIKSFENSFHKFSECFLDFFRNQN